MQTVWCAETYNEMHAMRADLNGKITKRKANLKGRVTALQQEAGAQLLEAGKQIEKHQQSVSNCLHNAGTLQISNVWFGLVSVCGLSPGMCAWAHRASPSLAHFCASLPAPTPFLHITLAFFLVCQILLLGIPEGS